MTMNPMSLERKKILITGASSGIGRATSIYCSNLGAKIVLVARNEERLEETLHEMKGSNHMVLKYDFNDPSNLCDLFEKMLSDNVKFDGLVHCIGKPSITPLNVLNRKRLHDMMDINYYVFIDLIRNFTKMKYCNNNASIVGISSSAVIHPRPYETGYITSKAALEASIPIIAQELWKRKIRMNCVSPGTVITKMTKEIIAENDKNILNDIANQTIMGWQYPEEIAKVCAFLLSDVSSAITAQTIRADGGYI